MKYIFPYIFALVYWTIFFVAVAIPGYAFYLLVLFMVLFIGSIFFLSGRKFYQHWNVWLNYFFFFLSNFGIVLISASPTVRNLHIMFFGVLSGFIMYATIRYLDDPLKFLGRTYLNFIGFIYLITFWQLVAVVNFMMVSFDVPIWQALVLIALLTFLIGRGIILNQPLTKSSPALVLMVLTITTAELALFLIQLPIHYYVVATLTTAWLFFIIEMVLSGQQLSSRRVTFRRYLLVLLLVLSVVLITALWQ